MKTKMPSRITTALASLKSLRRKAFAAYVVAGAPDLDATEDLVFALEEAGASIIELGVPFSDPMADGPAIQRASERALKNGVTLDKVFALVSRVRRKSEIPILLMGYYNPVLQFGLKNFAAAANKAGVDGALIVDLPAEESDEFATHLKKAGIDLIFLATPTSDASRLKLIEKRASGFVYYVSLTGVTGAKTLNPEDVANNLARIRKNVTLPILVGFGISKPEHVRNLKPLADGVVVGSAFLNVIEKTPRSRLRHRVKDFAKSLIRELED
jgi:tryptophan synthase alpha chain